jgi:hypothetical protein
MKRAVDSISKYSLTSMEWSVTAVNRPTKKSFSSKEIQIAINNAKRNFDGTYHKIKDKFLQLYLYEFIYKLNKRYFGERIFERLVIASISTGGH